MYTQNQITKIKSLVNSYFANPELKNSLKTLIKQEQINLEELDDNQLIEFLKKTNLMEKLMKDLENLQEIEKFNQNPSKNQIKTNKIEPFSIKSQAIGLKIIEGKAFVEYIQNFDETEHFLIDLSFLQHRFRTNPIKVSHEPKFNEVS